MIRAVMIGAVAVLGLALLLAACVSDRPHPAGPDGSIAGACRVPIADGPVGSVGAIVAIHDFRFVPDTIRVPAGTTVTWINCDDAPASEPHTTTSDGGVWASQLLSRGDLYARRFDAPGVFSYHCEPHPFMTATVIVE